MGNKFYYLKIETEEGTFWGTFQRCPRTPSFTDALLYTARMFKAMGVEITDVARRKSSGPESERLFILFEGSEHPMCGKAVWEAAGRLDDFHAARLLYQVEHDDFLIHEERR